MEKIKLKFRVDPEYLKNNTEVEDAIRITFIDPEKVYVLGMLGESGRTMMLDGAIFEFERKQAEWMIEQKIAVLAENGYQYRNGVLQLCWCNKPLTKDHDGSNC